MKINIEYEKPQGNRFVSQPTPNSKNSFQRPSERRAFESQRLDDSFDLDIEAINFEELVPSKQIHSANQKSRSLYDLIKLDNVKMGSSHQVKIGDINVWFPFKPYDAQVAYMAKVIEALNNKQNALLQSPTGTGKTLCLLCATLAWLNHYRDLCAKNPEERKNFSPVKILYSTRTHSQIKQVVKEIKQTCYRPVIALLGSKTKFCIKDDFSKFERDKLNKACKKARNPREEDFEDYEEFEKFRCKYWFRYSSNKSTKINQVKETLCDVEEIVTLGKKECFCPYFLERDLAEEADIILLPYNYLLDGRVRKSVKLSLADAIVVFDEAHNIDRQAEDGASFTLSTKDIGNCINDMKLVKWIVKRPRTKKNNPCKLSLDDVIKLKYPILSLIRNMNKLKSKWAKECKNTEKNHAEEGVKIFEYLTRNTRNKTVTHLPNNPFKNGLNINNFASFLFMLEQAIEVLSDVPASHGGLENLAFGCHKIFELLRRDIESKRENKPWSENHINHYMFQTSFKNENGPEFSFSLSCLYPGIGFKFILNQLPRSVILTSGTLAPLSSFETEFNTIFPVKLLNNHVINTKTQCSTLIVTKGVADCTLNFSFGNREKIDVYKEIGDTLINICKLVKNGIIFCFASYILMDKCLELWEKDGLLQKLKSIKPIYQEPKESSRLPDVMKKYFKDAKTKGAILCCVCRGKVSEGIDFADEMARAVILIGVPFPCIGDTSEFRVDYKRKYLDQHKFETGRITGKQWYDQQTIRAVNQAVGRVIRHINDYGMVFLCDERYAWHSLQKELSGWVKENVKVVHKFGLMVQKIHKFFKDKTPPVLLDSKPIMTKEPITLRENIFLPYLEARSTPDDDKINKNIFGDISPTRRIDFIFEEQKEALEEMNKGEPTVEKHTVDRRNFFAMDIEGAISPSYKSDNQIDGDFDLMDQIPSGTKKVKLNNYARTENNIILNAPGNNSESDIINKEDSDFFLDDQSYPTETEFLGFEEEDQRLDLDFQNNNEGFNDDFETKDPDM